MEDYYTLIRTWRGRLEDIGISPVPIAKASRVSAQYLRALMREDIKKPHSNHVDSIERTIKAFEAIPGLKKGS